MAAPGSSDPHDMPEAARLTPRVRHQVRRLAWLYLAASVALLPWIVYLALTLPRRSLDAHYRAGWVGFDLLLVFALVRTAYMAFRVDPRVQLSATAAATLLMVDAWFDITSAAGRAAVGRALLLAVVAELPIALFCLYVARRVCLYVLELAHLEGLIGGRHPPAAIESSGDAPDGSPGRPPASGRRHHPFGGGARRY